MTHQAATEIRQWLVSARSRGELLTSSARAAGIDLVMVGVPAGYSAEEVESWLHDLMGMSIETSSSEPGERPIPALLHHLLTGLIFSHSELWDRGGALVPTSLAFVRTATEVAFGWVNGPPPELWIDDHPARVEWVKIRDQDGREAFALSIDPAHRVRVHFGLGQGAGGASAASVDAAWVPEPRAVETGNPPPPAADAAASTAERQVAAARSYSTISRAVGARATAPADSSAIESPMSRSDLEPAALNPDAYPKPPEEQSAAGWTVVYESAEATTPDPPSEPTVREGNWWSSMVNWVSGGRERDGESEAMPTEGPEVSGHVPDRIPPTPEPAELTARAAPVVSATAAHAGMREIQLSPLAPEDPGPPPAARPEPVAELRLESARLEPAPRGAIAIPRAALPIPPAAPPAPAIFPPAAASPMSAGDSPFIEPDFGPRIPADPDSESGRVPLRPRWTDASPAGEDLPAWRRPWLWAIAVAVLFLGGWLLGGTLTEPSPGGPGVVSRALRAVGLGGARFEANLHSHPSGAWITVDGKDLARRTPTVVDLAPGTHRVTLSFADLGAATFEVRGVRNDKIALNAPLWGSLAVYSGDGGIPVAIAVDGIARGIAPLTVDSLTPGTHEVRFSGPGLQPWGQTVQVRVQETAQLAARAVTSPATGVLEIHALWTDAEGSEDLAGATVHVDGERSGVTPLTLELPRGPHSIRIESRGEKSPVQVIDLPGGNQRFANFELGLGIERPELSVLGTPIRVPLDQPAVISAALQGMHAGEAREMWLHLRQPDGAWRRYPMVMMKAPGGIVGSTVFPNTLLDSDGRTPFYVSATSQTGDDFFSEILTAQEAPAAGRR